MLNKNKIKTTLSNITGSKTAFKKKDKEVNSEDGDYLLRHKGRTEPDVYL